MEKITDIESEIEKLKIKAKGMDWSNPRIQKTLTDCANALFDLIGWESCHFHISQKRGEPVAYEFSVNSKSHAKRPAIDRKLYNKVISSFMGKDKSSSMGWVRLTYNEDNELSFSSFDKRRLSDLAQMVGLIIHDTVTFSGEVIKAECNQLAMIFTFIKILEAKSQWTFGHSARVTNVGITLLTAALGNEEWVSRLDQEEVDKLERWFKFAGLLHDIGKIGISDAILDKPDKLTKEEFEKVKIHAGIGGSLLEILGSECTDTIIPMIKHHHENFDGTGYPHGLKGDEIPVGARILKIADVFCAVSEERPYRDGLSYSQALNEIKDQIGKCFDPVLADIFCRLPSEYFIEGGGKSSEEDKFQEREDKSSFSERDRRIEMVPGDQKNKVVNIT